MRDLGYRIRLTNAVEQRKALMRRKSRGSPATWCPLLSALSLLAALAVVLMAPTAEAHNKVYGHQNGTHRHICMWHLNSQRWGLEQVTYYSGVYAVARSGNNLTCNGFARPACYTRQCSPGDDWYRAPRTQGSDPGTNPHPPQGVDGDGNPLPPSTAVVSKYPYNTCAEDRVRIPGKSSVESDGCFSSCSVPTGKGIRVFGSNREFTGSTVTLVLGRQNKNEPLNEAACGTKVNSSNCNPLGYCNCPGSYELYKNNQGDGHLMCGPAQCDTSIEGYNFPQGQGDEGVSHNSCSGSSGQLLPQVVSGQQQADDTEPMPFVRYYDDNVNGEDPLEQVNDDGQYSFLVESELPPLPGTERSLDRSDDWNRVVTSTVAFALALYANDGDGPLPCPFMVEDGHTVEFEWNDGFTSLTLPLASDPAPFVSQNGQRCVIHVDQDQAVTHTGNLATVPSVPVVVTFSPDI